MGRRILMYLFLVSQGIPVVVGAEDLYNQIGILKGQVVIVNNPDLGRTPASGMYFILQRVDCSRCLIGVHADIDGRYAVSVGIGRYRLYCDEPEGSRASLIRRSQPREATVQRRPNDTVFNIELELPKGR